MSELAKAVTAVMREVGYVQKTGRNQAQGFKYASEGDILSALRPAMVANGLSIMPVAVVNSNVTEFTTAKGGQMHRTDVTMRYRLLHTSGDFIDVETVGCGMDSGDKDAYKALTGAYKYIHRQVFGLETGDDPDQDAPAARKPRDPDVEANQATQTPQEFTVDAYHQDAGKGRTLVFTADGKLLALPLREGLAKGQVVKAIVKGIGKRKWESKEYETYTGEWK